MVLKIRSFWAMLNHTANWMFFQSKPYGQIASISEIETYREHYSERHKNVFNITIIQQTWHVDCGYCIMFAKLREPINKTVVVLFTMREKSAKFIKSVGTKKKRFYLVNCLINLIPIVKCRAYTFGTCHLRKLFRLGQHIRRVSICTTHILRAGR